MERKIYSFYELVGQYKVKIPMLQRDYAQGREENISICEKFLKALKESISQNKTIHLDDDCRNTLKRFFYETRLSARRFGFTFHGNKILPYGLCCVLLI